MSGAVEGVALAERLRAAVTYQYMPMSVRKLLSEAAEALTTPPARSYADGVAVELLQRWEKACEQHNALLASGADVTGAKVKRSGSKCASLYSQLTTASVAAIRLLSQEPQP